MFMYIYDGKEAERKVDENIDDEIISKKWMIFGLRIWMQLK